MDQFGVLVENMGVKVHGRSAPMAKLKHKPQSQFTSINPSPFVDSSSFPVDELDGIFRSSFNGNKTTQSQNVFGDDHIFGGSSNQFGGTDLESMLISSNKTTGNNDSDINSIGSNDYVDFLGLNEKHSEPVHDDVFRIFEDKSSGKLEKKGSGVEDLLPGFGDASPSNPGIQSNGFDNIDDLLSGDGVQQKHDSKPNSTAQDSQFDLFFNKVKPEVKPPPGTEKDSSVKITDDYTSLFGDVAISPGEFEEMDGEPEERREARLKRYMRMKERMDEALAEKNQRDLQSQQEQEEKRRLAGTLDYDIKHWAAGKEGNLRALLSSLEQVLWPGCGWRAVSIAELMTSDSVKKVYRKATLYVHPDKVQQKGANLQQKYVAEKVFDLLKEAWNKFNAEELRRI